MLLTCPRRALLFVLLVLPAGAMARGDSARGVDENPAHVARWNRFAEALVAVHQHRIDRPGVVLEERRGGYGDSVGGAGFYHETEYRGARDGRLLSRIRRESAHPERVHVIELFVHDEAGRVLRDYAAAYLPGFRNAPIQTLVTLHDYADALHAFRTFDASGNRLYEHCEGEHLGARFELSLTEEHLPFSPADHDEVWSDRYVACFGFMSITPGRYLDPTRELSGGAAPGLDSKRVMSEDAAVLRWSERIASAPSDPHPYIERAKRHFERHAFSDAVADLDRAIALEPGAEAYFWRGMALGRDRRLAEAIRDLDVFLSMRPESSFGHTKRGIRHFWAGDERRAERDFRRAIELDASNAEAYDDLGVIVARRGEHRDAIELFRSALRLSPGYFKAHHNLAVSLHLTGEVRMALDSVERAIDLAPRDRDATLLKAELLDSLGEREAAARIRELAEFLPEAGWSERSALD